MGEQQSIEHFKVVASDGTTVGAWRGGDPDGLPVVVSPGLGSPPEVWLGLTRPGSGFRVMGVMHRGLYGNPRPETSEGIRLAAWMGDLLTLMDAEDVQRPLVLGWSMGVNASHMLASHHPDRVAGLLGVCGVPAGTFAYMGAPWHIPAQARESFASTVGRVLLAIGPVVDRVLPRLPVAPTAHMLQLTRLVERTADFDHLKQGVDAYLHHDWSWFFRLALAS